MRWLLLLLLLTAGVGADPQADIAAAVQRFHQALAAAKSPSDVYPLITKKSIADLEAEQKKHPAEFAKVWELGKMLSTMLDEVPPGAKKVEELEIQGDRATYVTGYTLKTRDATSSSTQKTMLEREEGHWKIVFKPQP